MKQDKSKKPEPDALADRQRWTINDSINDRDFRELERRADEAGFLSDADNSNQLASNPWIQSDPPSTPEAVFSLDQLAGQAITKLHDSLQLSPEESTDFVLNDGLKDRSDWSGRQIGKYRLVRKIGWGGGGTVYEAWQDAPVRRKVAIKFVTNHLAKHQARWETEPSVLAELNHPNLVSILEANELDDGTRYLVMKFVDGQRFNEWVTQHHPAPRVIAEMMLLVARAIDYAHCHAVLHRDLKPSNILIANDGSPIVTDFGLAKLLTPHDCDQSTRSGQTIGTPGFLAPEQISWTRDAAAPTVDVYGFGATLYHLLTGSPPTRIDNWGVCIEDVLHRDPPPIRLVNPAVCEDLQSICFKCLEKSPTDRYQSMAMVAGDLQRYLQRLPTFARPVNRLRRLWRWAQREPKVASLVAAIGALLIAASILFGLLWQQSERHRTRLQVSLGLSTDHIFKEDNDADRLLPDIPASLNFRIHRLHDVVSFLETLIAVNPNDQPIRKRLAVAYFQLGTALRKRGDYDECYVAYCAALKLFQTLSNEDPDNSQLRFDIFHTLLGCASIEGRNVVGGEQEKSMLAFQIIQELAQVEPGNAIYVDAFATQSTVLAGAMYSEFDYKEARRHARNAIHKARQLVEQFPCEQTYARPIVIGFRYITLCDLEERKYDSARQAIIRAVNAARQIVKAKATAEDRHLLANTLNVAACVAVKQQEWEVAEAYHADSMQLLNQCIRDRPDHVEFAPGKQMISEMYQHFMATQQIQND